MIVESAMVCRYPKIIVDCIEDQAQFVEGEEIPVDTSQPNPNGMEFDNLYLVCPCIVRSRIQRICC